MLFQQDVRGMHTLGLSSVEVTLKRPLRCITGPSDASSTAIAIKIQQDLNQLYKIRITHITITDDQVRKIVGAIPGARF